MTHPKAWLKHFSMKFRLWTKNEIFLPKKEHFMRTGFMYFGQLFKVFIRFTAVMRENSQPPFWQNNPCGILVSGVCLAVVNFHLANFYPKIRSTIVASINGSCQAGVIQSGINPLTINRATRTVSCRSSWNVRSNIIWLSDPVTVFDYDKIIFSFQLWANNNIRWLRNIFINYMD